MQQKGVWQGGVAPAPAITLHGLAESLADTKNSIDRLRQETREQFVDLKQTLSARLPMQPNNALVNVTKERDDLQELFRAKEQENASLRERLQNLEQRMMEMNDLNGQVGTGDTSSRIVSSLEPDAEKIVLQSIDASPVGFQP